MLIVSITWWGKPMWQNPSLFCTTFSIYLCPCHIHEQTLHIYSISVQTPVPWSWPRRLEVPVSKTLGHALKASPECSFCKDYCIIGKNKVSDCGNCQKMLHNDWSTSLPNNQSIQVLERDGTRMQPCLTPAFMGKKLDPFPSYTSLHSQSQSTGHSLDQQSCRNPIKLQEVSEYLIMHWIKLLFENNFDFMHPLSKLFFCRQH